jgi:hypothetical protein
MVSYIRTHLSQRTLKTLMHYDPETGVFTWLVTKARSARAGDEAGTLRKDRHITIAIRGTHYTAQRLAWLYMRGEFPEGRLTFKDGNPTNTRWKNIVLESKTLSDTFSARYQRDLRRRKKIDATGGIGIPDPELQLKLPRDHKPPIRQQRDNTPAPMTPEQAIAEWRGRNK